MIVKITNNILSKDGEDIGKIENNVCSLLKAVGPTVKSAASAAHGSKLTFVVLDAEGAGDDEGEEGESGPVGIPGDAGPPGPVSTPAYPKPERDPINGDKCPKLIAWKEGK